MSASGWIELTSRGGRRMVARADDIVFMADHPGSELPFTTSGPWGQQPGWTDVVLRSGERGECRETIDQILQQIEPTQTE